MVSARNSFPFSLHPTLFPHRLKWKEFHNFAESTFSLRFFFGFVLVESILQFGVCLQLNRETQRASKPSEFVQNVIFFWVIGDPRSIRMIPLHEIVIKISNPTNNYTYTAISEPHSHTTTTKLLGIDREFDVLLGV